MGVTFVHFKCRHCGHCCRDVVCLPTPWDVLRIAMNTGKDPRKFLEFLTPEEIEGVNKSDPAWLKIGKEKYIMALRRDGATGCFFLDSRTRFCSIYEQRPILCRLYPYKLHETQDGRFRSFSLHQDVGCPRHRDGIVETQPLYALYLQDKMHHDDYAVLVETFNSRTDQNRRPEDFLNLFLDIVDAP